MCNVRAQDSLGRWGGEEFVLVCRPAPAQTAMTIAEKLRRTVSEHVFEPGTDPLHLTVSIGVASVVEGECLEQIVKRADLALHEAKPAGRNCVVCAVR